MSLKGNQDKEIISNLFLEVFGSSGAKESALSRGEYGLVADFNAVYNLDPEGAVVLLEKPMRYLETINDAAREAVRVSVDREELPRFFARVRNLPEESVIRRVGSGHIGKLVQVSGIAKTVSMVQPMIVSAAFKCRACGVETKQIPQEGQFLKTPQGKCDECGESAGFDLYPASSRYTDQQWLTVQEPPDQLNPGQMPRELRVEARGGLCREANPGDRVRVVCVVDVAQDRPNDPDRTLALVGRAVDILATNQEAQAADFTPEDEARIREIAADPLVVEHLLDSFAPTIYGMRHEKRSALCSLFSGVPKESGGIRVRGDIHTLYLGDPGVGKSQLLRLTAMISPRGVFTTGRSSSAAGLTAAVVRDKDQGFYLEAGALVLADKGTVAIDELDKMRDEDREAIHPAIEQQIVAVAKGGINTTLNSRCGVVAAANPKLGRWNPYKGILDNMDLPVSLLNRFDLIWIVRDSPEQGRDAALADHVLATHQAEAHAPPIDARMLRRYISYARRINPVLTREAAEYVKAYYLKLRGVHKENVAQGENTILITARQLESIVRVGEAHARMRLHERVERVDIEDAVALVDESMRTVGIDPESGERDMDAILVGIPKNLQERMRAYMDVVGEVKASSIDKIAEESEVNKRLVATYGWKVEEIEKIRDTLIRDGRVWQPRLGRLSLG
jgi:replicative DNA helicase Mcm